MDRQPNGPPMTIDHNGLRLYGPSKPHRGAYIRVGVMVLDPKGRTRSQAWDDAVQFAYETYGTTPTEDGTVGQAIQVGKERPVLEGATFSLGLNLYYHRQRDVLARISAMKAKASGGQ